MAFRIRTEPHAVAGPRDGTVYILEQAAGQARAEVWPALGFNCFRWHVAAPGGPLELLYQDPDFFNDGRPTRTGIPILFPFPNRIRDGRFTWEGKEYRLPLNDPAQENAIHGWACRNAWRVVAQGADDTAAWLTGEFRASADAPDARPLWPADYRLRVTYRLGASQLRIEATVENPDTVTLPFGLGYHPYFRVPFAAWAAEPECRVQASAAGYWELVDSLPTGEVKPVDERRNLLMPRKLSDLALDDVLTDLTPFGLALKSRAGTFSRGGVWQAPGVTVDLSASSGFRELVVFTPSHRQAVCLEPYTCVTDAINLQQAGVNAGLRVLPPGGRWEGVVTLEVHARPLYDEQAHERARRAATAENFISRQNLDDPPSTN